MSASVRMRLSNQESRLLMESRGPLLVARAAPAPVHAAWNGFVPSWSSAKRRREAVLLSSSVPCRWRSRLRRLEAATSLKNPANSGKCCCVTKKAGTSQSSRAICACVNFPPSNPHEDRRTTPDRSLQEHAVGRQHAEQRLHARL